MKIYINCTTSEELVIYMYDHDLITFIVKITESICLNSIHVPQMCKVLLRLDLLQFLNEAEEMLRRLKRLTTIV